MPSIQLIACMIAVVMIGLGLTMLRREAAGTAVFFVAVIVIFPLAAITVREAGFLYPRYFLLSVTFLLLLGAWVVAEAIKRGAQFRIAGWVGVAAFVAMNSLATMKLFADGRGAYRAAFQFAAESPSQSEVMLITGNQDFRILLPLQFYAPTIATNRRVQYLSQEEWPAAGADAVVFVRDSVQRTESIRRSLETGSATPTSSPKSSQPGRWRALIWQSIAVNDRLGSDLVSTCWRVFSTPAFLHLLPGLGEMRNIQKVDTTRVT